MVATATMRASGVPKWWTLATVMVHVAALRLKISGFTVRRHCMTPHVFAVVLALMLLLAACTGSGGSAVAATVGEKEIRAEEVERAYRERTEAPELARALQSSEGETVDQELQREVLTNLIRREILRLAADDQGIEVTEQDLVEERTALVELLGGQAELDELLAANRVSDEQLRNELRDQAIQTKLGRLLREDVSRSDVRTAFEDDPQNQYGPMVGVRHILTGTRAEARDAIERIDSGEDFADVARAVSTDTPSAQDGGDLGEIARGQTVPAFEEAAFDADEGEVVGPVETEFGFHVLQIYDRVAAQSLTEVEDEIRAQLEEGAADRAVVSTARPETPELPARPRQPPAPSTARAS